MTNEDAIKWIKAIKEKYIHGGDESFDECRNEALDMAIKALENSSWIPVTTRDLSAEEMEELVKGSENMFAPDEIEHWCFDCRLPDDNQEVIVSTQWGVRVVTFYADYDYGCYFEGYEDRDDVLAWMPLPEPYTKEENS